ncbi:hypothetical protein GCM10007978_00010 [Shewanella hanedai]|uniref:hypothetical protein n=1 Tax=Shewanella hanedai TaxID=25 RepID=UPI0019C96EDC|nr:hypothetical protein [Shewanella hanedai]GGI66894.1 hypothetical protein GCM10007978_00010 [Shewanella hanedai]
MDDIQTKWRKLKACIALPMVLMSTSVFADIGDTPVIGGVFNASEIMRDQIVSSLSASTKLTRDIHCLPLRVSLLMFISSHFLWTVRLKPELSLS